MWTQKIQIINANAERTPTQTLQINTKVDNDQVICKERLHSNRKTMKYLSVYLSIIYFLCTEELYKS